LNDSRKIGVVIVTFNSAELIDECLESLFASKGAELVVAVVDNASVDGTVEAVQAWASGSSAFVSRPDCPIVLDPVAKPIGLDIRAPGEAIDAASVLTVVRSPVNTGYAGAVNMGLALLEQRPDIDAFWVLNPDCVVDPAAASGYLQAAAEAPFGMLGSRLFGYEQPDHIQVDGGGRVNRRNGVCSSINRGKPAASTPLPDVEKLDYLTGANMVVSREFLNRVGPMFEEYFIYYEEVDWAFRRGNLPVRLVPGVRVFHRGGAIINAGAAPGRQTPFSLYFNNRNRLRFVRRYFPGAARTALGWTVLKACQAVVKHRDLAGSRAILAGAFDRAPPASVSRRISDPPARTLAFGRWA
jgi:GT2 family glycosyltransferase